jgi:hypothetical protein
VINRIIVFIILIFNRINDECIEIGKELASSSTEADLTGLSKGVFTIMGKSDLKNHGNKINFRL